MPRGLNNWTFRDVRDFLLTFDFRLSHIEGSHYFYESKINGIDRNVCIPFHGARSLHPKTLKSIIRQSGIPAKSWAA